MNPLPVKRATHALSALVLGATLYGCSTNNSTATAPTKADTPDSSSHQTAGASTAKDDHDAEIRAALSPFFRGAELVAKPFPFTDTVALHLSKEAGVTFSGKEGHWQVFDAVKNGQRVGLGVMTHSALPDGKDMHIAFGVNPTFTILGATPLDAPDNAKMKALLVQMKGKTSTAAFKVGKDLKAVPGLAQPVAKIGADAIHKGLVILEENFNPQHGAHETGHGSGVSHQKGDGNTR